MIEDVGGLEGRTVTDREGHRVGTVGEVFLGEDMQSHWVTVRTGLFGRRESFVPLEDAELENGELRIPYGKAMVHDAPHYDPDSALTEQEENELHRYYDRRPSGTPLRRQTGTEEKIADMDELPEERPRVAAPQPPEKRGHFEAEGVLLHPDEDDQIRRSQIDFDGESGRDRV